MTQPKGGMRRHYSAPKFGYELTTQTGQEEDRRSSSVSQLTRAGQNILQLLSSFLP